MKRKNEEMDIVFLLDRSGSMGGIETDTIGGYNSYINEQKKNNAKVTTVLFDDRYEMLTKREDIKNIKKLTNKEYYVRGCTALLDAIGNTINFMDKEKANKVMFVITTDGMENASKEFTRAKIKEMIQGHKDWEFIYIGADIDSYSEGQSIGIDSKNISNYRKDKKGVSMLYSAISNATENYRADRRNNINWKQDLEKYVNDNISK
jgi:uncharacterized protein YegL